MKKNMIITLITTILVGAMFFSMSVLAETNVISDIHDHNTLEDVSAYDTEVLSILPRWMCSNCWTSTPMRQMCAANRNYLGEGTHAYGLLWQKTCTFKVYSSKGAHVCFECGAIEWFDGEHYCLEIHSECGLGNYNICPFGG